jgi:hypothetical protein
MLKHTRASLPREQVPCTGPCTKSCMSMHLVSTTSTAVIGVTLDQSTIFELALSLVSVVETRGIEPLTPALQKHGVIIDQMEHAGQRDASAGLFVCDGRCQHRFGAIAGAIKSTVDVRREARVLAGVDQDGAHARTSPGSTDSAAATAATE